MLCWRWVDLFISFLYLIRLFDSNPNIWDLNSTNWITLFWTWYIHGKPYLCTDPWLLTDWWQNMGKVLTAMTKSLLSDLSTDKSEVNYLFTDLYLRNIARSHRKLSKQTDWPYWFVNSSRFLSYTVVHSNMTKIKDKS